MAKQARARAAATQDGAPVEDGFENIEVIDDEAAPVATPAAQPATTRQATTDPDDDVAKELESIKAKLAEQTKQSETDRQARAEAEKQRDDQKKRTEVAVNDRVRADEVALNNAIAAAEAEIQSLEADYKSAFENADAKSAMTASRKLATLQNNIDRYSGELGNIDAWKKRAIAQAEAQQNQPPPVQQQDEGQRFTSATKAWLEKHPDVLNNQRLGQRAAAYAIEAEDSGIARDTDEYFKFVEGKLWPQRQQAAADTDGEVIDLAPAARNQGASVVSTAARPSRSGAASGGSGAVRKPTQVRLSEAERDMALRMNTKLPAEERLKRYAANKLALIEAGTLDG